MNNIFKVIWSKTKNSYVVVSEIAKRNGKCSPSLNKKLIAAFLAAGTVVSVTGSAWAANTVVVNGDTDAVAGGSNSIAIGSGANASDFDCIAIGADTIVTNTDPGDEYGLNIQGIAIGSGSYADGERATAIGLGAFAQGMDAMAIGGSEMQTDSDGNELGMGAMGINAMAIGPQALAKGMNATAIGGQYSRAIGSGTTTLGAQAWATANYATALGSRAQAIGRWSVASGAYSGANNLSVAVGPYSMAGTKQEHGVVSPIDGKTYATAVGLYSTAIGAHSTATGAYSQATGDYSIADGYYSQATGEQSTAVGYSSKASGKYATALGTYTNYSGNDSEGTTALGYNSGVTVDNGVALGRDAVANTEAGTATKTSGYDPVTGKLSDKDDATWRSTKGAVSVGNGGTDTRQITNVAAGSADTDAVNVAQLIAAQIEILEGENVKIKKDTSSGHTKYTVSATGGGGGGGIAEISFNGDNKDAQIDNPKVLNIEGGATGELSDGNIGVESDGKDTLTVKLAKDIKGVDSITVNKNIKVGDNTTIEGDTITTKTVNADTVKVGGTTINDNGITTNNGNGPSVTKDGIDAGGKKITNVAPGTADNDAATVGQLKNASGDIYNEINRLDNSTRKGIAGAAALAALHPMDFNPDDKLQFSAGVGNYRGETAAALGMFYRPDESVMFSLGGTFGNSDNMVNAGITFGLDGTRNRITRSRTAMAREIQDLRSLVTQMAARMDRLEGVNIETAMFPDVPENHWAYEYVEDLQKRGALKGYPDGLFKGDRAMTRYEFAAMLDRLVRSGVTLDSKVAKEFEPELGRIYVERISGQDNDRKKVERVRVNNSDSKYPEGKSRDVYGSKIVTEIPKKPETK